MLLTRTSLGTCREACSKVLMESLITVGTAEQDLLHTNAG